MRETKPGCQTPRGELGDTNLRRRGGAFEDFARAETGGFVTRLRSLLVIAMASKTQEMVRTVKQVIKVRGGEQASRAGE